MTCRLLTWDVVIQELANATKEINMCKCENKDQADAWLAVWETLMQGNPKFHYGNRTGQGNAVAEIKRLYEAEKRRVGEAEAWKAAHSRVLEERNGMIDQRDSARHERDGESRNKNAAIRELDKERERHTETLKLLEQERAINDRLARELVKSRDELARAQSPLPPTVGGGAQMHMLNIRQYVTRFEGAGQWRQRQRQLGETLYYLLERDQLQTAAIKRLSERLDALEPNAKQPAEQRPMAPPWEMQPSGGFNPG